MGPYGSVGAHIKTGRSPMAQDHFQTPPDPQKGYENPKMNPKTRTNLIKGFHERLPNLALLPCPGPRPAPLPCLAPLRCCLLLSSAPLCCLFACWAVSLYEPRHT